MLFTPIVLMTVMGIAVNFLCDHQIPAILKNLCGVLLYLIESNFLLRDITQIEYLSI
jgi:hypothetical protein